MLERYIYGTQSHVPELIVRRDGQRLRLISDLTGSVRVVVDADTGAVLQQLSYDAYGRATTDTNPGLQPYGFKGALSDPVAQGAGLVWMGTRAYQPSLARFATPEPLGVAVAWNQTDALAGDPVNLQDSDGRFPDRNTIADSSASIGDEFLKPFCLWQCDGGGAARAMLGVDEKVNPCSSAFARAGVVAAFAVPLPGPGKFKAAGQALKKADDVARGGGGFIGPQGHRNIPANWVTRPAKGGRGQRYWDPDNPKGNYIRIEEDAVRGRHVHATSGGKQVRVDGDAHIDFDVWDSWNTFGGP